MTNYKILRAHRRVLTAVTPFVMARRKVDYAAVSRTLDINERTLARYLRELVHEQYLIRGRKGPQCFRKGARA